MSGTSADSADAALVDFGADQPSILATASQALAPALKNEIHQLSLPGNNEVDRLNQLDHQLGEVFASVTLDLLRQAQIAPREVCAIGSHGQTVRHQPALQGGLRYTVQIGNPHLIAERTGILTIADFRRRDIVCGGQGAPLTPAFHEACFASPTQPRSIVNIGGIANVTRLEPGAATIGFDTGPGNTLMDAWVQAHLGHSYDAGGQWAASAEPHQQLLQQLLEHGYFQRLPPKSCGREDFNASGLQAHLAHLPVALRPAQVQATLLEFTARTIADAISTHCPATTEVFICGGGAHNSALMQRLGQLLPHQAIDTTRALGIDPDWVETAAFAWLAKQYVDGRPDNLPSVTGAGRRVVLGAAYPA